MIRKNESFIHCGGKMIAELIGGSTLYGLNNADSDVDYRGLFFASNPRYVTSFDTIESIVLTNEVDATYYELTRYLKLLRKTNTQVMEILFAPPESFTSTIPLFEMIRDVRYDLIDSDNLKNSLKGYVFSEIRLATGERSGQLGGKRKESVTKYGFSPKNFVQILRLCHVGIHFYEHGEYMVNVKDVNPYLHNLLMNIKNYPEDYTCDQLKHLVDSYYSTLVKAMENSKIKYKFNVDTAVEIIEHARYTFK